MLVEISCWCDGVFIDSTYFYRVYIIYIYYTLLYIYMCVCECVCVYIDYI